MTSTDKTNQVLILEDGRRLGFAEYGAVTGISVFHFHGSASSRLERPGQVGILLEMKIRFISVDRPGHGLSDFLPNRCLIDWPRDVRQLADHLGIDKFYVEGYSAGGPHALACAHQLPDRVLAGALIASVAPMNRPGAYAGLPLPNQILARSARQFPWFTRLIRWAMQRMVIGDGEKSARRLMSSIPDADKQVLYTAENAERFVRTVREGFRSGCGQKRSSDMKYNVVPLDRSDLCAAVALLAGAYQAEREMSPLLPAEPVGNSQRLLPYIEDCLENGCVGAFCGGELVGFMGVSAYFPFKGQKSAMIQEFAHASRAEDKFSVYQALYQGLGEVLAERQAQLHLVGHFAGDQVLRDALFSFGFGAVVAENLRNLAPVQDPAEVRITQEHEFAVIEALETEHKAYYRNAPIFLIKDTSAAEIRAGLAEQQQGGNALFVYWADGEPAAYFTVGSCLGEQEGFLLRDSNSAQVLAAYAKPSSRDRGIGKALLNRAVSWAKEQGYDRLMVEHETANVSGGNFWRKHFRPYLYFSMRYVENCRL